MEARGALLAAGLRDNTVGFQRVMFNVLDLAVQAPGAVPDFIRKLPNMQAAEFTIESVAKARADSYINPSTGRLEASGFGNSYNRLFQDQRSRAGTFDYKEDLMGLVWSNEQGRFIDEEEQLNPTPGGVEASTPADVSSINPDGTRKSSFDLFRERAIAEQTANQQQAVDMLKDGPESTKPVLAQGPGQATTEVLGRLGNAGTALATDYADLGAGIIDTFVQGGNFVQGKGFDFDEWFNDSNNPLTKGRLEFFEPETQLGDAARPWIRGGVALLTLPKHLLKWGLVTPLKMASKVPIAGKAANLALKGGSKVKGAAKAKFALQADEVAKLDALTDLSRTVTKGSKAGKLPESMTRSAWLFASYDDIGKAIKGGAPLQGMQSWMDDVALAVKGFGTSVKNLKLRTVGEALAWDAFVAFNMAGEEGNDEFDEGFSNFLVESGWPGANAIGSPLATTADDNAITRKVKGTLEGTLMGALIFNPLFDMYRLVRFSRNFRNAGPKQQAEILKRLSAQAQDIGTSMGENQMKLLPAVASIVGQTFSTDELLQSVMKKRVLDDEQVYCAAGSSDDATAD